VLNDVKIWHELEKKMYRLECVEHVRMFYTIENVPKALLQALECAASVIMSCTYNKMKS